MSWGPMEVLRSSCATGRPEPHAAALLGCLRHPACTGHHRRMARPAAQLGLGLGHALEVCHRCNSLALPLEQRSAVDQSQWQVWVDAQQGRRVAPDRTHRLPQVLPGDTEVAVSGSWYRFSQQSYRLPVVVDCLGSEAAGESAARHRGRHSPRNFCPHRAPNRGSHIFYQTAKSTGCPALYLFWGWCLPKQFTFWEAVRDAASRWGLPGALFWGWCLPKHQFTFWERRLGTARCLCGKWGHRGLAP